MRARIALALLVAVGVGSQGVAHAQGTGAPEPSPERPPEHTLILGVGGAAELDSGDGSLHGGANVMVEWDVIENWLELEVGASVLAVAGGTEVPVDLLVKKPFALSRWAEVMVGVGPEVVQVTGSERGTFFGGEAALDCMFWPWGPRVGLWVEPELDVVAHDGVMTGLGSTGGLLLGW